MFTRATILHFPAMDPSQLQQCSLLMLDKSERDVRSTSAELTQPLLPVPLSL